MEELLQRFKGGGNYTDLSAECAELFHARCENFLKQCMLQADGGLLGRVKHYVRRYEAQGRGALHAHILLWVHADDVERVAQEITASMPCVYAETSPGFWRPQVPPADDESIVSILSQQLLTKQMHTCRHSQHGCRPRECANQPRCKKMFPAPPHREGTTFDAETNRYEYFRFCEYDQWIVPYHPGVLLCWNGHMNIQRITNTEWSYYVLKYAAKEEPTGELHVDEQVIEALGIHGISVHQAQLAVSVVLAKPFSPTEAYCVLTNIPIIEFGPGIEVTYIDTQPPEKRTRLTYNGHISTPPVDTYAGRPVPAYAAWSWDEYWTNVDVRKKSAGRPRNAQEGCAPLVDAFNNNVWPLKEPRIVRYTTLYTRRKVFSTNCCLSMRLLLPKKSSFQRMAITLQVRACTACEM